MVLANLLFAPSHPSTCACSDLQAPAAAPAAIRKRPASASLAGTPPAKAGKKSPAEKAYDRAYEKVKKYWLSQGNGDTVAKEFAKEAAKIARAKARAC